MPVIVQGEGSKESKMCLIGEAPGEEEIRKGRPFVGSSGNLLNTLLHSAGISRASCYIINVIKERPPNNKVDMFIRYYRGKTSLTDKYNKYEKELYDELSSCKANVFVALGNIPLYALTRKWGIEKWRGSILEGVLHPGTDNAKVVKVVATNHPASALDFRSPLNQILIISDLIRALEESKSPDINLPIRHLIINPSFYDCLSYLEICSTVNTVAVDIEVMNRELSHISLAVSPNDAISIPFVRKGESYFLVEQEVTIMGRIAELMENDRIRKVCHHAVFDTSFLLDKYGIKSRNIGDTMVATAIVTPDFPKALSFPTSIYTREPYYKDDGKIDQWKPIGSVSDNDFSIYNAKDSAVCFEILKPLEQEITKLGNEDIYREQTNLIPILLYMQQRGIRIDIDGKEEAKKDADKRIDELTQKLSRICGMDINSNSPAQLRDYFYIKKGVSPYIDRKTKKPRTDEDALKRLARRGYPEASMFLECRRLLTARNRYYNITLDNDGRMRCSFNPVGTVTGRLSSSQTIFGTGGNLQNIPPNMLKLMLADEGYILYEVDLAQAENRIVAYVAPEGTMIECFENNIDLHRKTAALIFGKKIEDVSDEPGSCPIGDSNKSERFWGKTMNHALNYDMGFKEFALQAEITELEAKILRDAYHRAYPGIARYHAWVREKLRKDRTLENLMGRKRKFLQPWSKFENINREMFKKAYDHIPQSTVADIINKRGLNFVYYNPKTFWYLELLNQVHDSIVFQIPANKGWDYHALCLREIKKSLETTLRWRTFEFVIPAEFKIGLNFGDKLADNIKGLRKIEVDGKLENNIRRFWDENSI